MFVPILHLYLGVVLSTSRGGYCTNSVMSLGRPKWPPMPEHSTWHELDRSHHVHSHNEGQCGLIAGGRWKTPQCSTVIQWCRIYEKVSIAAKSASKKWHKYCSLHKQQVLPSRISKQWKNNEEDKNSLLYSIHTYLLRSRPPRVII